jgi:hypothetical protein
LTVDSVISKFSAAGAGPVILSFGTNVTQLTSGQTVRFVGVLTDPDGVAALVGGHLTSPDGTIQYGAFVADQQGSYSLDLSWDQINQAQGITFTTDEMRMFRAEFFDVDGHSAVQNATLRLHCNGLAACTGQCVDLHTGMQGGSQIVNCGSCGNDCSTGGECRNGRCVNWTDCVSPASTTATSCSQYCAVLSARCQSGCLAADGSGTRWGTWYFESPQSCSDESKGMGFESGCLNGRW